MSLAATWILFNSLPSDATLTVSLPDAGAAQLGLAVAQKLKLTGGIAGYFAVYVVLYSGYYFTIDRNLRMQYEWQHEALGGARVVEQFYQGVSSGNDCPTAFLLMTPRLIQERVDAGAQWETPDEFCKYYSTNTGHTNLAYKRIRTNDDAVRFLVTVDFTDAYIRNSFAEEMASATLASLDGIQPRAVADEAAVEPAKSAVTTLFEDTLIRRMERLLLEGSWETLQDRQSELRSEKINDLLNPGAVNYVLRKFELERRPDASLSPESRCDFETRVVESFEVKIFTLAPVDGELKINNIQTALTVQYSAGVPLGEPWRL